MGVDSSPCCDSEASGGGVVALGGDGDVLPAVVLLGVVVLTGGASCPPEQADIANRTSTASIRTIRPFFILITSFMWFPAVRAGSGKPPPVCPVETKMLCTSHTQQYNATQVGDYYSLI